MSEYRRTFIVHILQALLQYTFVYSPSVRIHLCGAIRSKTFKPASESSLVLESNIFVQLKKIILFCVVKILFSLTMLILCIIMRFQCGLFNPCSLPEAAANKDLFKLNRGTDLNKLIICVLQSVHLPKIIYN